MCSRDFPFSGLSLRLRMIVGCGPPNPSRGPISTEPSSSRSSTTKSRTSHQNRASTSGSRQPSTSSLIRHAMNETCSQPGNRRGDLTELHGLPEVDQFRDRIGPGGQDPWSCNKPIGYVSVNFNQYAVIEYAGLPVEAYYG